MLQHMVRWPLANSISFFSRTSSEYTRSPHLHKSLARLSVQAPGSWLQHRFPRRFEQNVKQESWNTFSTLRQMTQRSISPQIYCEHLSVWQDLGSVLLRKAGLQGLHRESSLKVVSWNTDFMSSEPSQRVATAMEYLQKTFGNSAQSLVIMLQEVCQESVNQIMQTRWVRRNFAIAGHEPPRIFQAGIPRPAKYFTLMMIPKNLKLKDSFRVALPTDMGRDALFVDIQLHTPKSAVISETKDVLRLCTTHLESLEEGTHLRKKHLELIWQKLNEAGDGAHVVAGLIGGDMNAIHDTEHTLPKQLGLRDAWEDLLLLQTQSKEMDEAESPYSQLKGGITWGYQSNSSAFIPNRLDKFLYAGSMKPFALMETQGPEAHIGRIGIGLKTDILSNETLQARQPQSQIAQRVWVSDHFGIAIGIKVRP
jgi:tyrosyl-DNA phosphodiesterase 2